MNSLKIETGEITLAINGDESKTISFNPNDLNFVEGIYTLLDEFSKKEKEFATKADEIDKIKGNDETGLPISASHKIKLTKEICQYMRNKIDGLFGENTSQTVFGNALYVEMFEQFFSGIVPFIQSTRNKKIEKYNKPAKLGVMK